MLSVGTHVSWQTKSRGVEKEYQGTVIGVVPPFTEPLVVYRKLFGWGEFDTQPLKCLTVYGRDIPSYLVRVEIPGKKAKVYSPKPEQLRLLETV